MSLTPQTPSEILAAYAIELATKWGPTTLDDPVSNRADNLVRLMSMSALSLSDIEAKVEALVLTQDPNNLEGASLTAYAAARGVQRLTGTSSKAVLVVTGQQGAVLAAGSKLVDRFGSDWSAQSDVILESSGAGCAFATGVVCSDVVGNFMLGDDELVYDNTTTPFIFAATNGQILELGGSIESDSALRNRLLNRGPLANVNGTKDNAIAAILELNDVNFARFDFATSECLGSGPMFVVHGGDSSQICDTITLKSGVACNMIGEVECGSCTDVRFQRPCPLLLCIEITVNVDCPITSQEVLTQIIISIGPDIARQTKIRARDIANLSQDIDSVRFRVKRPLLMECLDDAPIYIDPIDGSQIKFGTQNPYGLCAGGIDCDEGGFFNSISINLWEYFILDQSAITYVAAADAIDSCNATCPSVPDPVEMN